MNRLKRFMCLNCEMTYWTSGAIDECAHCGGYLTRAYTPTDVPGTVAVMRNEMEEQIVARSMEEIMSGFENLLAGE